MSIYTEKFEPIPSAETYDEAFKIADELYLENAGIVFHLMKRSIDTLDDPQLQSNEARVLEIGSIFSHVPGVDDEADETRKIAFLDGYYATEPAINLAYEGTATFDARHKPIETWHNQKLILDAEIDEQLSRQIRLMKLGYTGLNSLGNQAKHILNEWSEEAYPDDAKKAEIFKIGGGVLLTGSSVRQRSYNVATIKIETNGDTLDQEFQTMLHSDSRRNDL